MATITASAAGGKWTAGTAWEGGVEPKEGDDVILGAGSGNITVEAEAKCRSLDATNYPAGKTLTLTSTLAIGTTTSNGGLAFKFGSATFTNASGKLKFVSTSGSIEKITTNGKALGVVEVGAVGGVWRFEDAFNCTTFRFKQGELKTNGQAVTVSGAFSNETSATKILSLGASVIKCNNWKVTSAVLTTINSETSSIEVTGQEFEGRAFTYNKVIIAGSIEFQQSTTITTLELNSTECKVEPNVVLTVTTLTTTATNSARCKWKCSTAGKTWTLKLEGAATLASVELMGCISTGSNLTITGNGILDQGNNVNVFFPNEARTLKSEPPNQFTPSGRLIALIDPYPPSVIYPSFRQIEAAPFTVTQSQSCALVKEVNKGLSLAQAQAMALVSLHVHTIELEQEQNSEPYLIGNTSTAFNHAAILEAGHMLGESFEAQVTETLVSLTFRTGTGVNGCTSVRMGVFADDGTGKPTGAPLTEGVHNSKPAQNAWISANITNLAITKGTKYVLVVLPIGGNLHYNKGESGQTLAESTTGGFTKLEEASWTTSATGPIGFYGKAKANKPLGVHSERAFNLENLQSTSVTKNLGLTKKVTQAQTTTRKTDLSRIFSSSDSQTATRNGEGTHALTITQGQSASATKNLGVTKAVTQGQSTSVTKNLGLVKVVTQGQVTTLVRSLERVLSITQGQSVTLTEEIVHKTHEHSLSIEQSQATSITKELGRHLPTAQSQSTTTGKETGRSLAITQPQAATVAGAFTKLVRFALEQTQIASIARVVGRKLAIVETTVTSMQKALARTLSLPTKAQPKATLSYTKEPIVILEVGQGQTVRRSEALTRALTLTQPQAVVRRVLVARTLPTITQGQSASITASRAVLVTLTVEQHQSASRSASLERVMRYGQPQVMSKAVSITRALTTNQLQSVRYLRDVERTLALAQEQAASIHRVVASHVFTITQGTVIYFRAVERGYLLHQAITTTVTRQVTRILPTIAQPTVIVKADLLPLAGAGLTADREGASSSTGSYGAAATTGSYGAAASSASEAMVGDAEPANNATTGIFP